MTLSELNTSERIGLVLVIAIAVHLAVYGIRYLGHQLMTTESLLRWNKLRTLAGLLTSIIVFGLYFGTLGFVLQEFGVSLTAYLASASILGLAIGFGSQGVVQDVVTGLTVILTDWRQHRHGTKHQHALYHVVESTGSESLYTEPNPVQCHPVSARLPALLCGRHALEPGGSGGADADRDRSDHARLRRPISRDPAR
jgi:hypothetical protein